MEDENILATLCESRLIRSQHYIEHFNARDVADLIYLYCIVLTILKKDFAGAPIAASYAKHTMRFGNWDTWRFAYNDLGALIHILFGKDGQRDRLRDPKESEMLIKKMRFDETLTKAWLREIVRGIDRSNRDRRILIQLEQGLVIDNSSYKAVRRLATEWTTLTKSQKRLVMTRLLHALRVRARKSELLKLIETMAKTQDLEIEDANNTEDPGQQEKTSALKKAAIGAGLVTGAIGLGAFTGLKRADAKTKARQARFIKKV